MTTRRRAAVLAMMVALAACGSDDKDAEPVVTSTVATPTVTSPSSPVEVNRADFPVTAITAPIDAAYTGAGAEFNRDEFGIDQGTVFADWYSAGDTWAVHFRGLTPEMASGKCLGTSLEVDTALDFENVTNSPYGALACQGFTTEVLPPGSVHLCRATAVVYTSKIPIAADGSLYASIEQGLDDGTIQGRTSSVPADREAAPPIDVSQCQVIS